MEAALTVNALARAYGARNYLPPSARGKVLRKLAQCRTSALGGRLLGCDHCGHRAVVWNSCLDRHCPSCMGASAKAWVEEQEAALLPVPYFHIVFTLPRPLADLALYNKVAMYGILMRVSAEVLQTIAADKKYLAGKVGFVSVLHTWSQTLEHHPHAHVIVAGGALCEDGARWRSSKPNFFLPTPVLAALFRRRFLEEVEALRDAGELRFQGRVANLVDDDVWRPLVRDLRAQKWVVYAKRPFGGPQQVLRYLAKYTHRVAISNRRLQAFDGERVTFAIRPSASRNHKRSMTLSLDAFVERFLLHLLPKGFTRIRHYGFLAGRYRQRNLARIRELLGARPPEAVDPLPALELCPVCGTGEMKRRADLQPPSRFVGRLRNPHFASTGPPHPTTDPSTILALARLAA
ncbi:MAG: IS91 family transposase [Deltaproteobacteria bacterium]